MVTVNGYDIELSRGDTLALRIDLSGRDLPEGTDAVVTIKKNVRSDEVILQKRFNASNENLDIVLYPEETNLEPGVYFWDVRLQIPSESGGYEVYTPMEYASFVVLPVVGDDIGVNGDVSTAPELPVLQVLIADVRKVLDEANGVAASVNAGAQAAAQTLAEMQTLSENAASAIQTQGAQTLAQVHSQSENALNTLETQSAQMLAQVQTLSANAINAIQTKGAQTLAGIPDEYAALCAQTDGMSDMRPVSVDGKLVWETGSLSSTDGSDLSSTKRCRTHGFLPLLAGQTLYMEPGGQQYSVICYSTDGAFAAVAIAAWQTAAASYTASEDCMIRIVCAKTNGAEIAPEEVAVSAAVQARIVTELSMLGDSVFRNHSELKSCNLDDVTARGYYNLTTAYTYTNTPKDPGAMTTGMMLVFTSGKSTWQVFMARTNGAGLYTRRLLSGKWTAWNTYVTTDEVAKPLKILAVGNSFNQDAMAYLPPLLKKMLPDVQLTVATCYTGSADLQSHVDWYHSGTPYTVYNEWAQDAEKWTRYHDQNALTLLDVMTRHAWDIIFMQGTSSDVLSETLIHSKILTPGRQLLRILQTHAQKPFAAMWFQWMGRPQGQYTDMDMFEKISAATQTVMSALGMQDYVPVGAAIQSARTNSVLQQLGDGGNMLYSDQIHMQAGIPALIAAYTTALKVAQWYGRQYTGVYGCGFAPDAAMAELINATGLTHGSPAGVTEQNIRMAQEIAAAAVRNPDAVTDCSEFV